MNDISNLAARADQATDLPQAPADIQAAGRSRKKEGGRSTRDHRA